MKHHPKNPKMKFTINPDDYDINDEIVQLLHDEPFLADFSVFIRKVMNPNIETAMARYYPETDDYEIHLNPTFMAQFDKTQRQALIIHEFCHILGGHLSSRNRKDINRVLQNIAEDLAINTQPDLKDKLPRVCYEPFEGEEIHLCFPGVKSLSFIKEEGRSKEFYLEKLLKKQKEVLEQFEKLDIKIGHDDHSSFGNGKPGGSSPGENEDENDEEQRNRIKAQEKLQEVIRNSVDRMRDKSSGGDIMNSPEWGSVSKEFRQNIMSFITLQELSPEEVLSHFVGSLDKGTPTKRWSKIHRRLPMKRPGRRHEPNKEIAIAIDQSGSVGTKMLIEFNAFAKAFKDYINFWVVPFDSRVLEHQIVYWEKGEDIELPRVLQGGTDFNAPTLWANEQTHLDGLIICTDCFAEKPVSCDIPRMWVTNKGNNEAAKQVAGDELTMFI